jgi:16S rRNA (cytidine1402-2'-O)-methyltransferase
MAALSVAGLPTDRFLFIGFLPKKSGKRRKELEQLAEVPYTLVLYESPHRLVKMLQEIEGALGDRIVVVCRELTKPYEEVLRGTPGELLEELTNRKIRGEITLIVEGKGKRRSGN